MKKNILFLFVVMGLLFSCSNNNSTIQSNSNNESNKESIGVSETVANIEKTNDKDSAVNLAKLFYDEYITGNMNNGAGEMGSAEKLESIKRKYLTENLIEELNLRGRQLSCDAITNSQDNTALVGKLTFKPGKDKNTAIINYRTDNANGYDETTIELHFIDVDGQKLADELNSTNVIVDNGKEVSRYEYKTKWANKPEFTEEDINEMESIEEELDNLAEDGFIG